MNRENFLNRFQFEHNAILNKQVHSISTIQFYILISDRYRLLSLETQTGLRKFETKTFFICRLEQPGPKSRVDLNTAPDDNLRNLVDRIHVSLRLSGSAVIFI